MGSNETETAKFAVFDKHFLNTNSAESGWKSIYKWRLLLLSVSKCIGSNECLMSTDFIEFEDTIFEHLR